MLLDLKDDYSKEELCFLDKKAESKFPRSRSCFEWWSNFFYQSWEVENNVKEKISFSLKKKIDEVCS